jgi:hypothetical protein
MRSTSRVIGISADRKSIPRHKFALWRRQSSIVLRLNSLVLRLEKGGPRP